MARAQWARLNDGSWGAKVFFDDPFESVEAGEQITVARKDGKETEVEVLRVLWTGDDKVSEGARSSLVAIKRLVDDRDED